MKFQEINYCLRCKNTVLFSSYPIIHCKSCNSIMAVDDTDNLKSIKFPCNDYAVCIKLLENKTYINGKETLDFAVCPDISEQKLGIYLTFS